ncbi:serine protease [Nasonia vitripennis]|uniref:limulus clotting factor C n=1 Tax=Nasonia vitripennis TaxID=7425 RepID=A0A7M6UDQ9_NASVI|nr:serine protease [Nasonia vitripennis]
MELISFAKIVSIVLMVMVGSQNCRLVASRHNKDYRWKKIAELPSPPDCGFRQQAFRRVVSGVLSKERSWPWLAAIGTYDKSTGYAYYSCGGTLITSRHVVSAAHCFYEVKLNAIATLGSTTLDTADDAVHYSIKKIYIHPKYNHSGFENDVALLKLDEEVEFTDAIQPICLPIQSRRINRKNFVGESAFVAGWGALEFDGTQSNGLREAELRVIRNDKCQNDLRLMNITSNVICAGNEKKSPCQGDSGGPLMYRDGSIYYLIGIVSNGYRCGSGNTPAIFMRATSFTDYILANMH